MATYKEIQEYIKVTYGSTIKTCWIAHMKELCGLKRKDAINRKDTNKRVYPCPEDKQEFIREAFKHFDML